MRSGHDLEPRLARATVVVVWGGFACVYVLSALTRGAGVLWTVGSVATTFAVFGLQLAYVLPRLKPLRGPWLLAAQAVLCYLAVLGLGTSVSMLGFLAGSLLVTAAWPAAIPVLVSAAVAAALSSASPQATVNVTITALLTALVIFGLTTLADRAAEVSAARLALALAAAGRERLRIAGELEDGLGRDLETIARESERARLLAAGSPREAGEVIEEMLGSARRSLAKARAAALDYRSLSFAPECTTARALLAAAGIRTEIDLGHTEPLGPAGALLAAVLRAAVTDIVRLGTARHCTIETTEGDGTVRLTVTNDGVRTAVTGAEGLDGLSAELAAAGGGLRAELAPDGRFAVTATVPATPRRVAVPRESAYRLSVTVLAVVLAGSCGKALILLPPHGPELAWATGLLAAIVALQLRWTRGDRGRHWAGALVAQTVLSFLPMLWYGEAWLGAPGFLAGSLLLAFPLRAAGPLVAAVMAAVGAAAVAQSLGVAEIVNFVVSVPVTGLVVYGLVRVAQLIKELRAAREELARLAVVQERLRAARDLHDLLGHSLAAILLTCELARRLIGTDPSRAGEQLAGVAEMTERARADLRAASGADPELTLEAEAASARSVLAAAGIEAHVELAHEPLPPPVATVFGAVLREAVTNVLRHSAARHCRVETRSEAGSVRLSVRNDGVTRTVSRRAGSGLGNLTIRLAAVGGSLTARAGDDGWFRLEAEVASPAAPAEPSGTLAYLRPGR
ncbi:sensor histidine kinase [Actinomadura scrupuli]|uniref:sensor histidine kinase n=1 Tax=Actinomadura scrupuli TaxID=559629 RepID=UPI003D992623